MVTPTGAALVTVLADTFDSIPDMTLIRVGYGAGRRDWPDRPNLLRLALGKAATSNTLAKPETLIVLASNIDDMNPEWYGPLAEKLLAAGALDVWLTPTHMKKGRPAMVVEMLCKPEEAARLRAILFQETTTLGVREQRVTRWALQRQMRIVDTLYGGVRVKVASLSDGAHKFSPEHDDCIMRAAEHSVSVREVWLAAMHAAQLSDEV